MTDLFDAIERVLSILEGKKREAEPPPRGPFERWVRTYGLSELEVDLLVLALLPEVDSQFCATFKEAQPHLDQPRPTVGLGTDLIAWERHRMEVRRELLAGPLWRAGFLNVVPDVPFFDQPLLPSAALLFGCEELAPALVGETYLSLETHEQTRDREVIADEVERLSRWSAVAARPVVVSARPGALSLAAGLSPEHRVLRAWGKLEAEALEQAFILAAASQATLLLEISPDARLVFPAAARWEIPVIVAGEPADIHGNVDVQRTEIPRLRPAQALAAWRAALGESTDADLYALAAQTHLSTEQIWRSAEYVRVLEGSDQGLGRVLRTVAGEPRSPLARTVEPEASFDDLIVSRECRAELDRIVQAARLRTKVEVESELPPNIRRLGNIVALFHGDSGTGKTLAAEALANRLEMPLMVVDVSRVTSKYIGETEERLDALFREAEGFRAVLFCDEADAFFGARTDISDSNDRYANLETNYLLQRIEQFEGIVVLATNLKKNIDRAFTRRFRFVVDFERPTPGEQIAIWNRHLPQGVVDEADLVALARQLDLVGGEIRNVAVAAMLEAASRDQDIDSTILSSAITREFIKMGRRIPDSLKVNGLA